VTAIFLPVLLMIGALGGILFVFGRHLPDIKRNLQKKNEDTKLGIAPNPANSMSSGKSGFSRIKFRSILSFLGRLSVIVRFVGKASKSLLSFVLRIFHRMPRVPLKMKKGTPATFEDTFASAEITKPVTADIKKVNGHPLRYPEPLPKEMEDLVRPAAKKITKPQRMKEVAAAIVAPKKEEVITPEIKEQSSVPLTVSVEATKESRSISKRRLIGRVRQQSKQVIPPVVKEDVTDIIPEKAELPVLKEPTVPLEEKKVSFIDKEAIALGDGTQEISLLIQQGKFNQAESGLIDILSKNPRHTEAYRLLGIVYLKRRDFSQAREVFEEALRRDPEHAGLHGPLGFCYMSMGEYGKALSMYQQAHNMDETNIEYLEQLLVISARMDRRPLVKMIAKKILVLNPNHAEARKYLERVAVH